MLPVGLLPSGQGNVSSGPDPNTPVARAVKGMQQKTIIATVKAALTEERQTSAILSIILYSAIFHIGQSYNLLCSSGWRRRRIGFRRWFSHRIFGLFLNGFRINSRKFLVLR